MCSWLSIKQVADFNQVAGATLPFGHGHNLATPALVRPAIAAGAIWFTCIVGSALALLAAAAAVSLIACHHGPAAPAVSTASCPAWLTAAVEGAWQPLSTAAGLRQVRASPLSQSSTRAGQADVSAPSLTAAWRVPAAQGGSLAVAGAAATPADVAGWLPIVPMGQDATAAAAPAAAAAAAAASNGPATASAMAGLTRRRRGPYQRHVKSGHAGPVHTALWTERAPPQPGRSSYISGGAPVTEPDHLASGGGLAAAAAAVSAPRSGTPPPAAADLDVDLGRDLVQGPNPAAGQQPTICRAAAATSAGCVAGAAPRPQGAPATLQPAAAEAQAERILSFAAASCDAPATGTLPHDPVLGGSDPPSSTLVASERPSMRQARSVQTRSFAAAWPSPMWSPTASQQHLRGTCLAAHMHLPSAKACRAASNGTLAAAAPPVATEPSAAPAWTDVSVLRAAAASSQSALDSGHMTAAAVAPVSDPSSLPGLGIPAGAVAVTERPAPGLPGAMVSVGQGRRGSHCGGHLWYA